jgi:HAD superfamily hydrolase (TIGR01509 family)
MARYQRFGIRTRHTGALPQRNEELDALSKITAITFDLWQTLLLDNRDLGRARTEVRLEGTQQALERIGESYDLEQIRQAYRACFRHCQQIRAMNRDVSFRAQVEIFVDGISPGLTRRLPQETMEEILRAYSDSFFVHPPVPHEDAQTVLAGARDMGLKIGLISNTGMTPGVAFRRFLDQHGMLRYFDVLTFSDEVQLAKPGEEIFLMTLRELGAAPWETIHVGDHVVNDVVGARQTGMKTIWIEGFYPREDPNDPCSEPDVKVPGLGRLAPALRELCKDQVLP